MAIRNSESGRIAMSPSAMQKERLMPHNIFVTDSDGKVVEAGITRDSDSIGLLSNTLKMTACHSLFMACFNLRPSTGCVIHSHSRNVAVASLMFGGDCLTLRGLEMMNTWI